MAKLLGLLPPRLHRLLKNEAGGVVPLLALAALPLLLSVGAAVDYSRASDAKASMQAALDSTVLTIMRSVEEGTTPPNAGTVFNAVFSRADVGNVTVTSSTSTGTATTVSLTAQGTLPTAFMKVFGTSQLTIGAKSAAVTQRQVDGCVMALSKTAGPAISLGGSTNIALDNCALYSNSSSASSVTVSGSASLSAQMIGAVGGVSASNANVSLTNGIMTHLAPIMDPYANVAVPSFSGCADTNLKVKNDTTINPGVYCNGITINAGATLTLNPGVYYIDRGTLSINGGGSIIGVGVTLVFTSSTGANWATANFNGNATVNLTAPNSGATAGIVIMVDRNAPVGTSVSLEGGSNQSLGGAVYAPTGAISYSGNASTSASCTQIIGDTVKFTGNSGVAINCSSYKTKPFGASSMRIIS
jgi:Flp pilus assembly protein TadG